MGNKNVIAMPDKSGIYKTLPGIYMMEQVLRKQ